ncbi:hypothetical protein GUA87_12405 [Sneathiella sp. P13V-1]|uniref:hypothetical protein n=1 Tax=Sneathiella sp. P13V-1 TaxID=2697366 RepID=UPI00187B1430|nr:hypothetical protein [Sneathiella sp. P13V-1]MBE7637648.1 hypothetical protein [Sneathiella sp. P13V-1]
MKFLHLLLSKFDHSIDEASIEKLNLSTAFQNIRLIVISSSENSIHLNKEDLYILIKAQKKYEDGSLTPEEEVEFWIAYRQVSAQLKPITISSIKANFESGVAQSKFFIPFIYDKRPLSRKCASNYKLLSLVTLVLLIGIQIYWYIGWTLTNDISAQANSVLKMQRQLAQIESEYEASKAVSERVVPDARVQQIAELRQRIKEHSDWKDAASNHLENWNEVWSNLDLLTLQPWQVDQYLTLPEEVQRRIQFVAADNILAAITSYILPILYGLIGACFYILRQLPKEIENLTFSMNSYIEYSLRMAQGPLAGMMVSFFFASEDADPATITNSIQTHSVETNLSTLSPLALAFLAGYSVEFIFKLIDRMLSTEEIQSEKSASTAVNKNYYSIENNTKKEGIKPRSNSEKESNT